jgi:uncharacterized protein YceH (UPF0502 family)
MNENLQDLAKETKDPNLSISEIYQARVAELEAKIAQLTAQMEIERKSSFMKIQKYEQKIEELQTYVVNIEACLDAKRQEADVLYEQLKKKENES